MLQGVPRKLYTANTSPRLRRDSTPAAECRGLAEPYTGGRDNDGQAAVEAGFAWYYKQPQLQGLVPREHTLGEEDQLGVAEGLEATAAGRAEERLGWLVIGRLREAPSVAACAPFSANLGVSLSSL